MRETRKRGFVIKHEGLALIEQTMKEKGYNSREKLAEAAEYLSIDTVNRLFRGEKTQRKTIEAIAKALDLKPTDLVEHSEWFPASSTTAQEKSAASEIDIDWREVCRAMLEKQQESQRLRRKATEMGFEVNVHVPLGLEERKQQQRRDGNIEQNQLYQLDQKDIAKTYQHDQFLTEVIGQRQTRKNKNIAIVGEPGAGKTTLLGAIASFIQSNTEDLPICITLASLQERTLEDYLLKTWLSEAMGLVNPEVVITAEIENELIKQFRKGGVWLLLDGVDEMGADSPIQALTTIQKQLIDWLGQARVVLTCRVNVWDVSVNNILIGFDTYRTQEFTHEQIDKFIQDWFACAGKLGRGEQLQAKLKETGRERIRQLVKHPLRLALLCQSFYVDKQGDLPETKAALYQRFTRYFYEWKQNLHPKDLINQDELKNELHQALGKLALAGINSFARFRLKQSLASEEMGERLFKLADALGWLSLVDRDTETDEPVYAFFHPTFQEYFAALAVDDWDYFLPRTHNDHNPKPMRDTYRIFEPQWKEVMLLWLGREDLPKQEKEEFIKALVEFEDGWQQQFYRVQAYCLAAAGIAEFRDCRHRHEIVAQIVEWYLGYFNEKIKKWVSYPHWLSEEAKKGLKKTDYKKVISTLVPLIQSSQNESNTLNIAETLLEIDPDNESAINALIKLTQSTSNILTHSRVIEILLKINCVEAANKGITNIIYSRHPEKKRMILIRILKELGCKKPSNQSLIDHLMNLLQNPPAKFNREELIENLELSLLWSESQNLFQKTNETLTTHWLLRSISQDEFILIFTAAKGNAPQITFLFQLNKNTQDEEIGKCAVESLGKNYPGNEDALSVLSQLIQSYIDETVSEHKLKVHEGSELPPKLTRDEEQELETLRKQYESPTQKFLRNEEVWRFGQIIKADQLPKIVTTFKKLVTQVTYENNSRKENFDDIFWDCAQNMTYPDFYRAWYSEPFPLVHALENQFTDIASQMQPTDKTYPIIINAQALEGETDTSAIAQELCNQIYLTAFPDELEIPEVSNAPQLKRLIPQLKKQLQKLNLAVILDKCEPNQAQVAFCRKLTDVVHIAWITNQPLEAPLKGFLPEQANLLSAIQSWVNEIG